MISEHGVDTPVTGMPSPQGSPHHPSTVARTSRVPPYTETTHPPIRVARFRALVDEDRTYSATGTRACAPATQNRPIMPTMARRRLTKSLKFRRFGFHDETRATAPCAPVREKRPNNAYGGTRIRPLYADNVDFHAQGLVERTGRMYDGCTRFPRVENHSSKKPRTQPPRGDSRARGSLPSMIERVEPPRSDATFSRRGR